MARSATRGVCMAILLAVFLAAPHCFGVTREFTKTFPLQADGSFELSNVNGTVRIETWDKDEVEVRRRKSLRWIWFPSTSTRAPMPFPYPRATRN